MRDIEIEKEKKVVYVNGELVTVAAAGAVPPSGGGDSYPRELELDRDPESVDEFICIFTNPTEPGIMFKVDGQESKSSDVKYINDEEEVYITTRDSIFSVEWDKENNVANGTKYVMVEDRIIILKTLIVSEEKMKEICDSIAKSNDPNRVVINTGSVISHIYAEQNMYTNNNINNDKFKEKYDNFQQVRDNFLKSIEQESLINKFSKSSYSSNNEKLDTSLVDDNYDNHDDYKGKK